MFQWHSLNKEEQARYYEMARKERQLHMQLYPGWSARDNYAQSKKRKRKRLQEGLQQVQRAALSTVGKVPDKGFNTGKIILKLS